MKPVDDLLVAWIRQAPKWVVQFLLDDMWVAIEICENCGSALYDSVEVVANWEARMSNTTQPRVDVVVTFGIERLVNDDLEQIFHRVVLQRGTGIKPHFCYIATDQFWLGTPALIVDCNVKMTR